MGREIMHLVATDPDTVIHSAIDKIDNELASLASSEHCTITNNLIEGAADCDVIIDFSGAAGTVSNLKAYKALKKPVIIGSTGLDGSALQEIALLQSYMPVLVSSNMSVGVNVLLKAIEMASRALGEDFDIEIFEAHHKHKVDAPSGTALTMAEAAAHGRGVSLQDNAVYSREGHTGARPEGAIGFQVLRGGDIAGDHTVFFCGVGERIEMTHRASNRTIFAKGALRCAKWIAHQPNGLYGMNDVLGL
jgi:4-hydroxy-tetrahydrodipicolinate reductase